MKLRKTFLIFVVISVVFSQIVFSLLSCWYYEEALRASYWDDRQCGPFHKSCESTWYRYGDKIYNDRGCSYETDDGCIVKDGFGGAKQPWCFCNTNLCNNLTMEQYKMTNDMIQPGSDAVLKCWYCEHCGIHPGSKRHAVGHFTEKSCPDKFYKSCSAYYNKVGNLNLSDHGCSNEDIDGCCIKQGANGETEPWCFCKTEYCNNITTPPPAGTPPCASPQLPESTLMSESNQPPATLQLSKTTLMPESNQPPETLQLSATTQSAAGTSLKIVPEIFLFVVAVIFTILFRFL